MATNLRLEPQAEAALRAEARRSHRSQQDILREAVNRYLHLIVVAQPVATNDYERLIAARTIFPPRVPYRKVVPTITLPNNVTSLDLLDREERF